MNHPLQQPPGQTPAYAVYPCGPNAQWVLYPDYLAVMRNEPGAQPFTIDLDDLYGVDYKEPGMTSGSAQIRPVDRLMESFSDESALIFALDARHKQQRQVFLRTLASVAPHVIIQPVDVSPEKDLRRRINTARARASIAAREERKSERLAEQQALKEAADAAAFERSFVRADGTVAPKPALLVGSVRRTHLRLYQDAIVLVDPDRPTGHQAEIAHDPAQVTEMQWGQSEDGWCFVRLEPTGDIVHLDISNDPTAARCTPEEMGVALDHFSGMYPALRVRRIAVLADEFSKIIAVTSGGYLEKKIKAALDFIPGVTAERHLTGGNGPTIALDPVRQKFCVIDVSTWVCRIYGPSNLLSVEVYENSRMQVSHRRDGRGARALATTGFLVGDVVSFSAGLAANKASKPKEELLELTLRITLDDPKLPIIDMRLSSGSVKLSGGVHHSMSAEARTWASLINALIRSSEQQAAAPTPPQSIVAELAQLANLHAAGHLTNAEFAELKSRLIGR